MYGLVTKNDSGETQIDSTYRNLSLDESGSNVAITCDSYGNPTSVSLTGSSLVPLIAIRPPTDRYAAVKCYHKTSSNFDAFLVHPELDAWPYSAMYIDWKSYRENRVASGEDYGLLVYNSDGDLCFDSGKSYLKIREVHSVTLDDPTLDGYDPVLDSEVITHSSYSNPYYILSRNSYWELGFGPTGSTPPYFAMLFSIGVKKVSSTSVNVGWFQVYGAGYNARIGGGFNPTIKLLVCE